MSEFTRHVKVFLFLIHWFIFSSEIITYMEVRKLENIF